MYVFDNCSLRVVCENYYPTRFPSLWAKFNGLVSDGKIVSVEVLDASQNVAEPQGIAYEVRGRQKVS